MISGVYGVLEMATGRWYVGWSHNVERRWRAHKNSARRGRPEPLYAALRAGGHFIWMLLQPCVAEVALRTEESWIAKLGAFDRGFNQVPTSAISPSKFEETRRKISAASSRNFSGQNNPFFGKHHSPETLAIIRKAAKMRGPEWRAKLSAAKGTRLSLEMRMRLRGSRNVGAANPFYGRRHSEEIKAQIAASLRGRKRQPYQRINYRPSMGFLGKRHSEETKAKMRIASRRRFAALASEDMARADLGRDKR